MTDPAPERSLALHLWNDKPLGWVAATDGPAMAAADKFNIRLQGKGGHGASPYIAKDPVVAAAQIITALQSIPARNVNALEAAVLSVTSVKGGEAFNVIPDAVTMLGTVRTFKKEVQETVMRRFEQVVKGIAEAMECPAAIEYLVTTPAVSNDAVMSAEVRALARHIPGVTEIAADERTMGSEDMAYLMDTVPGCYFFIGSANAENELNFPHHHPRFDFDERALVIGATLMAKAATQYVIK